MRITTWAEYGLIVSVHLAKRVGEAAVSARDVAEIEGLPADYVEQILLKLRRAGLVNSVRGAKGGYFLARRPAAVTVRDVIEATENRTFEVNCDLRQVDPERCAPGGDCTIRPVWRAVQRQVDELLGSVSLEDLTGPEAEVEEALAAAVR
ncbi:MAG: RrF2 family transcriptional regulator [Gemmatimonadales bacterium]